MLPNHPALRDLLGAAYADQQSPDQLTQLQRTAPDQIRTPGALGANLLADALLQYGRTRSLSSAQSEPPAELPEIQAPADTRLEQWVQTGQDPYAAQTLMPGGAPLGLSNAQFDGLWGRK